MESADRVHCLSSEQEAGILLCCDGDADWEIYDSPSRHNIERHKHRPQATVDNRRARACAHALQCRRPRVRTGATAPDCCHILQPQIPSHKHISHTTLHGCRHVKASQAQPVDLGNHGQRIHLHSSCVRLMPGKPHYYSIHLCDSPFESPRERSREGTGVPAE